MRRRATNMRGTPLRAGISWMLLEEVRASTEDFFNRPNQPPERPFQGALQRLFGLQRVFRAKIEIIQLKVHAFHRN